METGPTPADPPPVPLAYQVMLKPRGAICNLDCAYCDTRYARHGGHPATADRIVEWAAETGLATVEVTGGEPLLQQGTPVLLERLVQEGHRVLLETNGSLSLDPVPRGVCIIMDLKAPGSGMFQHNRWENLESLGLPEDCMVQDKFMGYD